MTPFPLTVVSTRSFFLDITRGEKKYESPSWFGRVTESRSTKFLVKNCSLPVTGVIWVFFARTPRTDLPSSPSYSDYGLHEDPYSVWVIKFTIPNSISLDNFVNHTLTTGLWIPERWWRPCVQVRVISVEYGEIVWLKNHRSQIWFQPVVRTGFWRTTKNLLFIIMKSRTWVSQDRTFFVYCESIKRDLKTKPIYECRCDEKESQMHCINGLGAKVFS